MMAITFLSMLMIYEMVIIYMYIFIYLLLKITFFLNQLLTRECVSDQARAVMHVLMYVCMFRYRDREQIYAIGPRV